jgi:hypothetical protein
MKARLVTALIAFAAIPAVGAEPLQQTRAELLAQTPAQVAETLLGNIATRFVTMAADPEDNHSYLRFVSLATAPDGTGLPGLCQAKVLQVALADANGHGAPSTVWSFHTSDVYKVIGDVDGPLGPLAPNEQEQARLCANIGPVVVPYRNGGQGARFFHYRGYGEPWMGVVALQGLIRGARDGRFSSIRCAPRELGDCRNPQAELGALDIRNLKDIEVAQPDPIQPNFLVRASFIVEPGLETGLGREVTFEFNGEPLPVQRTSPLSFDFFTYRTAQLDRTL